MIQRIQTIYLFLASIFTGVLIMFFDLWEVKNEKIFVFEMFDSNRFEFKMIPISFIASSILTFFTIFLFKNRKLQFVMGRITILINLFLLGLLIYLSLTLSGEMKISEKGIGMFLPVLAILFVVLANIAIKKDENLVKSVDRLR